MSTSRARRLDANDSSVREAFEKLFYRGFEHVTHNRLIRTLWDWDVPARRLRTRVPYEDQALWGRFTGERFDAGVSVNIKLRQLQSAAFGFTVPLEMEPHAARGQVCEIMALFVVEDNTLASFRELWNDVFEDLRGDGFTHALATTAPKILPLYRRIGALSIADAVIDGETRFFIHFDLARTSRWMKRDSCAQAAPELSRTHYLVTPVPPPDQALHLVEQELGVQLARLLVVLNIARGESDEGFDIALRRRSTVHIWELIRRYLSHVAAAPRTAEQGVALARTEKQLAGLETLTDSVHDFSVLARSHPGKMTATLVEALDLLILTTLRAWDREEGERELLMALTQEDRGPMLEKLRRDALLNEPEAVAESKLTELGDHFIHAVRVIHRLFGDATP